MSLLKIQQSTKPFIIGCDEVGYGCWAGPLVVCGLKAPRGWSLEGLNDSKKLSAKRRLVMRQALFKSILNNEISFHLAERSNTEIDILGLSPMLKSCYVEVFHKLYCENSLIITDGILKFDNLGVDDYTKISLIKADAQIPTVMAASILAKTYRDHLMKDLDSLYPSYNFKSNVGYGTKDHQDGLTKVGPCSLHRMSYAPLRALNKGSNGIS